MNEPPRMLAAEDLRAKKAGSSPRHAAVLGNPMGEGLHSAGYDARCTGYLLAYQALEAALAQKETKDLPPNGLKEDEDGLDWLKRRFGNQIFLTGLEVPMHVVKTQFGGGGGYRAGGR